MLTRDQAYLTEIPVLWKGSPFYSPHRQSREIIYYPSKITRDSGHWAYVNIPDPNFGVFYIDCSHTDSIYGDRWDSF